MFLRFLNENNFVIRIVAIWNILSITAIIAIELWKRTIDRSGTPIIYAAYPKWFEKNNGIKFASERRAAHILASLRVFTPIILDEIVLAIYIAYNKAL